MSFSMETKRQIKFSFPVIEDIREQGKFSTTIYRKPTCSGVYSNIESFLPSVYKFGIHLGLQMFSYLLGLQKSSMQNYFF